MGGGASVPAEMKQKIHTAFEISTGDEWAQCSNMSEQELRDEIKRLRQLALTCVKEGARDKRICGDSINFGAYTKKVIAKTDAVKKLIHAAMTSNSLFKRCRMPEKEELLDSFEPVKFGKGTTIIKQGDRGDDFFVLEMGTVEFYIEGNKKAVGACGSGKGFGELALMYNTPRAATVLAKTDIIAWKIDRERFRLVLANHAKARSEQYKALLMEIELNKKKAPETADGKSAFLRECITDEQLTKLADCMDEEDVDDGVDIIKEGEDGHTFYIIAAGEVEVSTAKAGKVASLKKGDYFGDRALVSDEKRAATCTAKGSATKVLAVDREDFVALLGSIDDLIKNGSNKEEVIDSSKRKAEKLGMEQITVIKTLGHGAFGRVKLVKETKSGIAYALKSQAKAAIIDNNLQDHVLMEREILMQLDHPFILKLICAFQDDYFIYFLLELLIGGELFTFLRKHQRFSEPTMKIYAAGVVLAFEHMHSKKIAYRDLKPENLVLDKEGYLKVVDLGLAKVVHGKTWTLCGTPDYLAPEIILNEGHDKAVDYWALGVLMYELVAGVPPFYADDPMEVYEKILSGSMSFPSHFGKYLNDIVRKLLKLCQSKRLGNGKGGCGAIKKHRFFSGFGWEDLVTKKIKPPIEVKVSDDADASNFDNYEEDKEEMPAMMKDWCPQLDD